jgi:hypothetical protein
MYGIITMKPLVLLMHANFKKKKVTSILIVEKIEEVLKFKNKKIPLC